MGSQRSVVTALLRNYPEIALICCATIAALLGSIEISNGDNADVHLFFAGLLCILYVILASIKLLKYQEKNLNSGFNMPIVLNYFIGLVSPIFWRVRCGECGFFSMMESDFILLISQPFFGPVILLLLNIPWTGVQQRKRFFFGVLLSIPFCLLSFVLSGFITNLWGYWGY